MGGPGDISMLNEDGYVGGFWGGRRERETSKLVGRSRRNIHRWGGRGVLGSFSWDEMSGMRKLREKRRIEEEL